MQEDRTITVVQIDHRTRFFFVGQLDSQLSPTWGKIMWIFTIILHTEVLSISLPALSLLYFTKMHAAFLAVHYLALNATQSWLRGCESCELVFGNIKITSIVSDQNVFYLTCQCQTFEICVVKNVWHVVAVDFDKAGQKQHAPHDGCRPCDLMTCTAVTEYAEYTAHWRVQQGSSKVASEGVANKIKLKLGNPPNHHIHLKSTCLLRKFIALPFFTLFCAMPSLVKNSDQQRPAPLRPCALAPFPQTQPVLCLWTSTHVGGLTGACPVEGLVQPIARVCVIPCLWLLCSPSQRGSIIKFHVFQQITSIGFM